VSLASSRRFSFLVWNALNQMKKKKEKEKEKKRYQSYLQDYNLNSNSDI
jgi:hypothetical protein